MPSTTAPAPMGHLFLPYRCTTSSDTHVRTMRFTCRQNAIPLRCLQKPPSCDRLIVVSDYRPPLNKLVHDLKFSATTALAPVLVRLMTLKILAERHERGLIIPDELLCVPLHHRRHWQRGYNQSSLLATGLSRILACHFAGNVIMRSRATWCTASIVRPSAQKNLKNAFQLALPVLGRHIALVDDIVTTGSTVAEIARLLKHHGAATV